MLKNNGLSETPGKSVVSTLFVYLLVSFAFYISAFINIELELNDRMQRLGTVFEVIS